jgi:hypothetical protein
MLEGDKYSGVGREKAMWEAMGNGTVKYARTGGALIPGDEGYDQGLPMKWNEDGMPVLPGNPEYEMATPIRPPED